MPGFPEARAGVLAPSAPPHVSVEHEERRWRVRWWRLEGRMLAEELLRLVGFMRLPLAFMVANFPRDVAILFAAFGGLAALGSRVAVAWRVLDRFSLQVEGRRLRVGRGRFWVRPRAKVDGHQLRVLRLEQVPAASVERAHRSMS